MRTTTLLLALALATTGAVHAADGAEKKSQQNRMSVCSADAKDKGLKGDARKQFMSECLSSKNAQVSQKSEKTCSAAAKEKGMKGDARKKFITDCSRAKPTPVVG